VQRFRYQLVGFVVWKGAAWYLRRRYGGAPKKLAAGAVVVAVVAALVFALRRGNGEPD
jgi:uncharacterized membrane protein YhfC